MKVEVTIHNWKRLENKDAVIEAANALIALAKQDGFEEQCASVKSPKWHVDNYGLNGLDMSFVIRK